MWLSISTAAAPNSERSAALPACPVTTFSTPTRPPRNTFWRPTPAPAISSSLRTSDADQRLLPATTSVATTTAPDLRSGSRPPATPKLMTPRMVAGSKSASRLRSWTGSLELQMTVMPGPAAIFASWTSPVTINTGRGSVVSPAVEMPPSPKITSQPLRSCCWCSSNSGTAPTPRAGRISSSHDNADKTHGEAGSGVTGLVPESFFRLCVHQVPRSTGDSRIIDLACRHQGKQSPCRLRRRARGRLEIPCSRVDS